MCVWLKCLKVPVGFSSNVKSLVSLLKDLKLTNYKLNKNVRSYEHHFYLSNYKLNKYVLDPSNTHFYQLFYGKTKELLIHLNICLMLLFQDFSLCQLIFRNCFKQIYTYIYLFINRQNFSLFLVWAVFCLAHSPAQLYHCVASGSSVALSIAWMTTGFWPFRTLSLA